MESSFHFGAAGLPSQDPNYLLYKMGIDYLEQARTFEGQGKIEHAYKFYMESANKFLYIIKNATDPNP
jgi:hypothetical protein